MTAIALTSAAQAIFVSPRGRSRVLLEDDGRIAPADDVDGR